MFSYQRYIIQRKLIFWKKRLWKHCDAIFSDYFGDDNLIFRGGGDLEKKSDLVNYEKNHASMHMLPSLEINEDSEMYFS